MSEIYEFAMGRKRALALAGCFTMSAMLLFAAGVLAGMLLSGDRAVPLRATSESPVAKTTPVPLQKTIAAPAAPPLAETEDGGVLQSSQTASVDARPTAQPELTAPTPGPSEPQAEATRKTETSGSPQQVGAMAAKPALAGAGPTAETKTANAAGPSPPFKPKTPAVTPHPLEVSYVIPLAVRVGSFKVKSNADALMVALSDLGYRPMLNHFTDSSGRGWYQVKLGPYTRWSTASAVAARVSVAEDVHPAPWNSPSRPSP